MSDHAATHDGEGAHQHSHRKLYFITAVILTIVTIIELLILYVPESLQATVIPTLIILSAGKLAGVIGIFMHLKDDRNIYRLLFLAPMAIAVLMILVLMAMTVRYYAPFGLGEVKVATEKIGEKKWTPEQIKEAWAAVQAPGEEPEGASMADGKQVFEENCSSCHRVDGGGGVGPNLTDNCFKNGGDIVSIQNVLYDGVPGTAMPPWRPILDRERIAEVSLYVRDMRGKNVEGGKECEGEKITSDE